MSVAIIVKYLPWTNHRPARHKASANGHSVTIPADKGPDAAARALLERMKWSGVWIRGWTETGAVYAALAGSFSREWCERYLIDGTYLFIEGKRHNAPD